MQFISLSMCKIHVPSCELGTSPTVMGCVRGGTPSLRHLLLAIISPASSILIIYMFAVLSQAGKETVSVSLMWKQEREVGEKKKYRYVHFSTADRFYS